MKKLLFLLLSLILLDLPLQARQFRSIAPITSPAEVQNMLGDDTRGQVLPPAEQVVIDQELLKAQVRALMQAWAQNRLDDYVGTRFPDRSRLLDAVATDVPYGARVDVISMDGVRILQQRIKDDPEVPLAKLVSTIVVANITTEVSYDNATLGHRQLRGTAEYTFDLTLRAHDRGAGR